MPDRTLVLAVVPLGIALNLALGTVVTLLRIPVYIDAVGTIIVAVLAGPWAGVVTGVLSFVLAGAVTNPVLPWFSGTQAMIALYVVVAARRGWFRSIPHTIAAGVGLGVVAGVMSAPVIVYLFGGITGSGASLIVAALLATGESLLNSVILSGLAAEPIDKTLQCLLAVWLVKGLPRTVLAKFDRDTLARNAVFVEDR